MSLSSIEEIQRRKKKMEEKRKDINKNIFVDYNIKASDGSLIPSSIEKIKKQNDVKKVSGEQEIKKSTNQDTSCKIIDFSTRQKSKQQE